jgi:hypothetical protein
MFMNALVSKTEAAVTRLLVALRCERLLGYWISRGVREWLPDGGVVRFRPDVRDGRPIVLVLQADRILADMEVLRQSAEIRLVSLDDPWLGRIAYQFLPAGLGFETYVVSEPKPHIGAARVRLRAFLRRLLPHFYRRVRVRCVVRTDFKLPNDFDWGAVSAELGIKYVLLQRENLVGQAPGFAAGQFLRDLAIGRFEGDYVITYNQSSKDRYVRAGTAPEHAISVLGCLRMDRLVETLQSGGPRRRRNRITVFALENAVGQTTGAEAEAMYRDVYATVARFAQESPDIEVIVKLKKKFFDAGEPESIGRLLAEKGIDLASIKNMSFTAKASAQDYIFSSDVVIGMNSMTILEAAVAGLPVIVPYFETLRQPHYFEQLKFGDDLDIFDVARDADDLKRLLVERMKNPAIDAAVMERRWQVFEKNFHDRDGRARERVVEKLLEIIEQPGPKPGMAPTAPAIQSLHAAEIRG